MPASCGRIHVPFAGRSNPISERLAVLAADSSLPEQSVSHQVTIHLCDGTSAAESPKAIRHLCSCAGQLGQARSEAARIARISTGRCGTDSFCLRDASATGGGMSARWRRCVMNKTNIEHPTSNAEQRRRGHATESTFDVRCSMFDVRCFPFHP